MTGPRISVLCPTRNRPAGARRLIDSARAMAAGDVEFILRTDEDAPLGWEEPGVTEIRGPRGVLSALWNECAAVAAADIFMQAGDDIVFRSEGWDDQVAEAFAQVPDRIVFVHGTDLFQPLTFGTHGFVHRRWTEATGYFTPPYFSSDYGDTWLNDVANMIGRRVCLPGVVTEHLHPVTGKASWDATYLERMSRGDRDGVHGLYVSLAGERDSDAAKLRAVMS